MHPIFLAAIAILSLSVAAPVARAQNLHEIPSDLTVPPATDEKPAAGRRVKIQLPEFSGSSLFHVLYLPPGWSSGKKYPVIVEYPGNGGFSNRLGDKSTGRVEDCELGYGISGGLDFIWVCLPFVDQVSKSHALQWWGDADATAAYCRGAVRQICEEFGGDRDRLVLTGFSRGAIATSYIGLRDEETAKLWRVIIAHSHFDGVRRWDYPGSDSDSARNRLARLKGRPLYVSHESSVEETRKFLESAGIVASHHPLPWPNHSADWVLKDVPERAELRRWLAESLRRTELEAGNSASR
ncbi:hypothetical protein GC170_10050 [bacterium]|nr:hypothetical protein [bacterium]